MKKQELRQLIKEEITKKLVDNEMTFYANTIQNKNRELEKLLKEEGLI